MRALNYVLGLERRYYYNPDDTRGYTVREAQKSLNKEFQSYEATGEAKRVIDPKTLYDTD